MSEGRNRFPFSAAQWEELEHQALIFKYIVCGIPIPHDLLFTIKTTPFTSNFFPHQYPQVGWKCLEMGGGRKMDGEPGRCRRTDGKKWRCSKDAFPDSKYCEKHMHRGKNRSRKPVELFKTTTTTPHISSYQKTHPFLYQPLDFDDFRYNYGVKEDVEEHPFPLTMSSCCSSSCSTQNEEQHFYEIMQSNSNNNNNVEIREQEQPEKIMHHFFDEFSPKNKKIFLP